MGKLILLAAVIPALILRGPFAAFGACVVFALPAYLISRIAREATRSGKLPARGRRWITVGAMTLAAAITCVLEWPPSGASLLHKHFGLAAAEVRDVRRWAEQWGIDAAYGVRFRADLATIERAAAFASAQVDHEAELLSPLHRAAWRPSGSTPDWWGLAEGMEVRAWSRPFGPPRLYLYYVPETGDAYAVILYF